MQRRNFLLSGTALALSFAAGLKVRAGPPRRRPNVLFVFSDQHRACSMPGEPASQVLAPNLAAFRDRNCSMDQCTSNYPLCSPYRAILMSGLYPQQSGMMGNEQVLDPTCGPLGAAFRDAGYRTGYIGKWHIHGQDRVGREDGDFIPEGPYRMGFEHWRVWANTNDHYDAWTFDQDTGEKIYPTGWQPVRMTDEAIDFVNGEAAQPDKPWFLIVSWNPPHPPFDPPEKEKHPYPLDELQFRPNVAVPEDPDELHQGVRSEAGLRKAMQSYLGDITGIDREFGRLMAALEASGQAEDTIVVYTSDHGEMMGSQGLMGKRVPFEESVRVPFYVRYPGVVPEGARSQTLLSAVDIYPSLCGLAGVPVPTHCAGRDLSGAMRGEAIDEPECVFLLSQPEKRRGRKRKGGHLRDGQGRKSCPPYRGVRTKTHTYVVADAGRWLLFDNLADPFQTTNLIDDPSHRALVERLDGQIEAWLGAMDDDFPYAAAKQAIYRL